MNGEKIYEYNLNITGMTDYGIPMDAILSGRETIPPQGARIDVAFEGQSSGRLSGRVRGVDYLTMRADGRIDLHILASIETVDGSRIALYADGTAVPRAGDSVADLCENVRLTTSAANYAWVHARQIWAPGTVDLATGKIHIAAYMQ